METSLSVSEQRDGVQYLCLYRFQKYVILEKKKLLERLAQEIFSHAMAVKFTTSGNYYVGRTLQTS